MSRIVDVEPLLKKYDRMNEGTEFSPIHFINDLMALEQLLYTEKEELLRVGKRAVKSRQGRFVIYDVEWLKKNFYSTEEKIYGQPKQPSDDCISRSDVKEQMIKYGFKAPDMTVTEFVEDCLPPVTPERPKGKWIEDAENFYKAVNEKGGGVNENTPYFVDDIACSECLSKFSVIDNETEYWKYCPNCGAKMEVEHEQDTVSD